MANAYTVALVGFAQNESATFESFFRLASRRPPAYVVQDEVLDAQLLVVNADNAQALHLVRYAELPGKVLLVGQTDGGTGWPLQRRPIKLVAMLGALDELVGARKPRGTTEATSPKMTPLASQAAVNEPAVTLAPAVHLRVPRPADSEFPKTRPMVRRLSGPVPTLTSPVSMPAHRAQIEKTRAAPPGVMGVTNFGGIDELPVAPDWRHSRRLRSRRLVEDDHQTPVPEVRRGDALLVAESLVEGRILHKRLKKYDLAIDWSREATQALAMLKAHAYRLVVIDRISGTPDAYAVCRAAKQRKLANGTSSVVILFAPAAGGMDRLKAGLAGSDAYLSRSVAESELYRVLAQHRLVSLDGFQKTDVGF